MLLVTKTHHERDETKGPDKDSLQDIGQVCTVVILTLRRKSGVFDVLSNNILASWH